MPVQQACPCLLGFALTMCGLILPTMTLYMTEARDREAFKRLKSRQQGGTDKCSCLDSVLIISLLLSLLAIIVWEAAVALAVRCTEQSS